MTTLLRCLTSLTAVAGGPLAPGANAPDFALPSGGDQVRTLVDLVSGGPAVLSFFKSTCPVCRMTFPVLGELASRFSEAVPVVAVAQDPHPTARAWCDELGFRGPVLDDDDGGYEVSDLYGIRSVPTTFLVDGDGTILRTAEGWSRSFLNELAADLGERTGSDGGPVSTEADGRPPAKPG